MALNVGILGHVDSGKTTLTRTLAEIASTNAFDKHADLGGRRNTIDLGFSSLTLDGRRLALVDCPGHAGLIKAVLAASSVLDMAIVIVDASNGIQPQTAEHLLLVSIFCPDHVVIVLNKIDLVEETKLDAIITRLRKGLKALGVASDSTVVPMCLNNPSDTMINELLDAIRKKLFIPERENSGKFLMAVDHCFPIKGKGTVLTGTVVDGSVKLNQEVEIPSLKEKRRVKGLESWKEPVSEVVIGERAAILVSSLSSDKISRTLISSPGCLTEIQSCLCSINIIDFFRSKVKSGSRLHISCGFETVMAECCFMRPSDDEYECLDEMQKDCVVFMKFEHAIHVRSSWFFIASKLEHQGKGCRFAFYGQLGTVINEATEVKSFVRKHRQGKVERIENDRSLVCNSLFKKETKFSIFEGMSVVLSTGEVGRVKGSFGKSGKARIVFSSPLSPETSTKVSQGEEVTVNLHLKKYTNDKSLKAYLPSTGNL